MIPFWFSHSETRAHTQTRTRTLCLLEEYYNLKVFEPEWRLMTVSRQSLKSGSPFACFYLFSSGVSVTFRSYFLFLHQDKSQPWFTGMISSFKGNLLRFNYTQKEKKRGRERHTHTDTHTCIGFQSHSFTRTNRKYEWNIYEVGWRLHAPICFSLTAVYGISNVMSFHWSKEHWFTNYIGYKEKWQW